MITTLAMTMIGRFWWQIPLALALVVGVMSWDAKRINRKVEAGKAAVVKEIGKANEKVVETSNRIRANVKSSSVRATPKNRDPYTTD